MKYDTNFIYIIGFILALIIVPLILRYFFHGILMSWLPRMLGNIFRTIKGLFSGKRRSRKQTELTADKYLSIGSPHFTLEFATEDNRNEILRINNPFRGVLVIGGAGSGKSETFANPIIYQSVVKGYAGIIYDYKFPDLANIANTAFNSRFGSKKAKQFIINFENLSVSSRVNPLHPRYIKSTSHAEEYATVIINNLMPESIRKTDFWVRSSIALLQASIWYFKEEHPELCTLPHIVNFVQSDIHKVIGTLRKNDMCARLISSIITAYDNKAEGQLSGVVATLQIALNKINTPEVSYILTGDDFNLDLNDPNDPKILILGNSPQMKETYSPLISLICTVALKMMNADGKSPSVILLDEAPTLYIPKLEDVPATGRSRKISVVYMAQDFSQMIDKYGKDKKDILCANLLNQFYGRVGHFETADYVSKLFGKVDVPYESKSFSQGTSEGSGSSGSSGSGILGTSSSSSNRSESQNKSVSYSMQERDALKSRNVLEFGQGQFASIVAETDDNIAQLKVRYYYRFNIEKEERVPIEIKEHKSVDTNFFRELISEIESKVFTGQQVQLKNNNPLNIEPKTEKSENDFNKVRKKFDSLDSDL